MAAGIHVGCDRLDDHLFVLFNAVDAVMDRALTWAVGGMWRLFGATDSATDLVTYHLVDLVDEEAKIAAGRLGALVVELGADIVVALPVFLYPAREGGLVSLLLVLKKTWRDPTLLQVVAPAVVFLTSFAGVFAIAREMQVAVHALASRFGLDPERAGFVASSLGFVVLVLSAWRLCLAVTLGAIEWSYRRCAVSPEPRGTSGPDAAGRKRRMRGLITAVLGLPIAVLAFDATHVVGSIRALLWM